MPVNEVTQFHLARCLLLKSPVEMLPDDMTIHLDG
jgi:hypothetical protein